MGEISDNVSYKRNAAAFHVTDDETGMITVPTTTVSAHGFRHAMELGGTACRTAAERYDWNPLPGEMETIYQTLAEGS